MQYWDVPFEVRGKAAFPSTLALFPEDPKKGGLQDLFLTPLIEEMKKLATAGVTVHDPYISQSFLCF